MRFYFSSVFYGAGKFGIKQVDKGDILMLSPLSTWLLSPCLTPNICVSLPTENWHQSLFFSL